VFLTCVPPTGDVEGVLSLTYIRFRRDRGLSSSAKKRSGTETTQAWRALELDAATAGPGPKFPFGTPNCRR
jgi:hypothetical protein